MSKNKKLSEELGETAKNLEYHKNDLLRIRDDIKRQIEKVEEYKIRVEKEILELFNEKVIVLIDNLGLEPLLAECLVE